VTRNPTDRAQTKEQFRLAIEAAPNGMIMVNESGTIVLVNTQTEKLFGYTRQELLGQKIEILVPDRLKNQHPSHRRDFLAEPRMRPMGAGRELFGLRKDGTEIPVEIGLNPITTVEGRFVLSSVVDVTERRKAEVEREELLRRLQGFNIELEERVRIRTADLNRTLKEREALLQEVHHRVKNNLQVVSSLLNIQMRRLEDGAARNALENCHIRVQAIALIHEKLYQSGDYSRVPFADYVRSLTANVFHAAHVSPSAISLEVAIEDISLTVDQAIPCGLIVNELIMNALKHAFPEQRHGEIRVEMERADTGLVRMTVKDDGRGLPAGLDVQRSDSLGLQLVYTLAAQLEATINVQSQRGTSFELTFRGGD
jgi:PAS domain S-box-containing protein